MHSSARSRKLPRSFYLQPTLAVARGLLGKLFVRKLGRRILIGKIVEVEAYREGDPASHSYRGKTKRNEVMFGEAGHLYVYFTYGMHFCGNVVTRNMGTGEAVLIRAVEPVHDIEVMRKKRGFTWNETNDSKLTNGPAKFCQAFGIGREQNGIDLQGDEIFIAKEKTERTFSLGRSTRVGIRKGAEKEWRFYIKGNTFVSHRQSR